MSGLSCDEHITPASFTDMQQVRAAIDTLDRKLIDLLSQRMACIVAASRLKTSADEARVAWRVADVIEKVRASATHVGFDPQLAQEIWSEMIERCITFEHTRLMEKATSQVSESQGSE
jgi:isochorismate pyruvate lyase